MPQGRERLPMYRVGVWFGDHVIVDQIATQPNAARLEAAMRRRFASLRVTNDPLTRRQRELTS